MIEPLSLLYTERMTLQTEIKAIEGAIQNVDIKIATTKELLESYMADRMRLAATLVEFRKNVLKIEARIMKTATKFLAETK